MPSGRSIPRPPAPRPVRPDPPSDESEIDADVLKAAGELNEASARISACTACDRASEDRAYGTGHPRAPILLVKERPSPEDLEATNAFASDAEALTKAFGALGVPVPWLYGSTAVRCGASESSSDQVKACAGHLLAEIEAVQPRVIVAFGPRVMEGIRSLDGRCGLRVPEEVAQGAAVQIRSDLVLMLTEPLPEGVTQKDSKRRLWRDLKALPELLGS